MQLVFKALEECTVAVNAALEETMGEEEGEDEGSSTEEATPADEHAPKPQVTLLVVPELSATGQSGEVSGRGPAISKRAWGKAATT